MPEIIPDQDTERAFTETSSQQKSETTEAEDVLVHPDFRLWLTTRPDVGLPLPAVLIQYGFKLACEAQENFRDTVRTNCRVVAGSLSNCIPVWGAAAANTVFKVQFDNLTFNRVLHGLIANNLLVLSFLGTDFSNTPSTVND